MKKAREGNFDLRDVQTLNQRLAKDLLTTGAIYTVIIIQKNKTCNFINQFEIEKYARENNRDIIIILAKYYPMNKDNGNLIQHKLLFKAQNEKKNCIWPSLLFYYKIMLACLLANKCTPLGIVNNARAIIHGVISNLNSKGFSLKNIIYNQKYVHFKD